MDTPSRPNALIIGIVVVVLLVAGAAAVIAVSDQDQNNTATISEERDTAKTQTPETAGSGENNAATDATGNYKDGTYQATGSYRTPGGNESIGVSLTIENGIITDSTVTQNARAGEAREYQGQFVSGYKSEVIGKRIDEVSLNRVSGSSLTPIGFNNAIQTIRTDAKS